MPDQSGIFYTEKGSGFPVILIHGFCETHEIWNSFSELLSKEFRIICIDLPGFGKSELLKAGFSITDVGSAVLRFTDSLKIKECIVIGHSLGGYVLLAMMEQRPELFKAFGLFHSTAFADTEERKQSRNKVIEFVTKHGVEPFIQSFIPPLFHDQNNPAIPNVVRLASQTKLETLVGYTKAMRDRPDRTNVLKNFKSSILFIAGEKDGGITPESIKQQAAVAAQSIVHILPSVAHMGMFENKELSVKKIHEFLLEQFKK
ncbi:MAG TPA: alpha/beta hydrolase [Cyclobacteriaceae bacterium]